MGGVVLRELGVDDVWRIGEIDRSERVDVEYTVTDHRIVERPVSMREVPTWRVAGTGPHTVADVVGFVEPIVAGGATFLGAFDGDTLAGVGVVDATFEPGVAWLAFLHVTRRYRRSGVASTLWEAAAEVARDAGAATMYVSATPTGSAVGFYLSRGCELAEPVHRDLYELEPDDIHLTCRLEN